MSATSRRLGILSPNPAHLDSGAVRIRRGINQTVNRWRRVFRRLDLGGVWEWTKSEGVVKERQVHLRIRLSESLPGEPVIGRAKAWLRPADNELTAQPTIKSLTAMRFAYFLNNGCQRTNQHQPPNPNLRSSHCIGLRLKLLEPVLQQQQRTTQDQSVPDTLDSLH